MTQQNIFVGKATSEINGSACLTCVIRSGPADQCAEKSSFVILCHHQVRTSFNT